VARQSGADKRKSALIVPIPEAEPIVAELRQAHDPSAQVGVPAHVTVLYPFVPADKLDDGHVAALRDLFKRVRPFAYRFRRVERFGTTTVYLAPEPARPFSHLTQIVAGRWPEHPPYEGAFEVVIPHMTVGDLLAAGAADPIADQTRGALARHGPIVGRAEAVNLIVEDEQGRWSTSDVFELGSPSR
jgi:hypothetical protein